MRFPKLTRSDWFGLIGVVGIVWSVYTFFAHRERRDLAIAYVGQPTEIVNGSFLGDAKLKVTTADGSPLTGDITAFQFAIWNAGEKAIRPVDVLDSLTICLLDTSVTLLDYRITRVSRPIVGPTLTPSGNPRRPDLKFGFRILEKGDGAIVQVIVLGSRLVRTTLCGTVEGMKEVRRESSFFRAIATTRGMALLLVAVPLPLLTAALILWVMHSARSSGRTGSQSASTARRISIWFMALFFVSLLAVITLAIRVERRNFFAIEGPSTLK